MTWSTVKKQENRLNIEISKVFTDSYKVQKELISTNKSLQRQLEQFTKSSNSIMGLFSSESKSKKSAKMGYGAFGTGFLASMASGGGLKGIAAGGIGGEIASKGSNTGVAKGIAGGFAGSLLQSIADSVMDFPVVVAIMKLFKIILLLLLIPLIPVLKPVLLALSAIAKKESEVVSSKDPLTQMLATTIVTGIVGAIVGFFAGGGPLGGAIGLAIGGFTGFVASALQQSTKIVQDNTDSLTAVNKTDIDNRNSNILALDNVGMLMVTTLQSIINKLNNLIFPSSKTSVVPGSSSTTGKLATPPSNLPNKSPADWAAAVTKGAQYASGTDYVPKTGLALLHKGEKVIPAGQSNGTIIINIDTPTFNNQNDMKNLISQMEQRLSSELKRRRSYVR